MQTFFARRITGYLASNATTNSMPAAPDNDGTRDHKQLILSGIDPARLERIETLQDGTKVLIRPIHEGDVELTRSFIEALSLESRRFRFLGTMKYPSAALLTRLTRLEQSEAAFIALLGNGSQQTEIGVARFSASEDLLNCECAIVVSDEWHRQGLATILMGHLIDVATRRGIQCMYANSLADNHALRELAKQLGFESAPNPNDATEVMHTLELRPLTA